jgi:hypothetical protein
MKNVSLVSRKWLQGGIALFALYAALQAGGIVVRLILLAVAGGCFLLWSKSKQALDALRQPVRAQELTVEGSIAESQPQMQSEPDRHFVKMPVRYPKPVYIHRNGFHLYPH